MTEALAQELPVPIKARPVVSKSVAIVVVGDVTDINCHSNLPYFFFQEGQRQGIFTDPIRLNLKPFKQRRVLWNLKQLVLGRGRGGYQYSRDFLAGLERQIPPHLLQGRIITFGQAFPSTELVLKAGGEIIYYIDATLRDLFSNPSYGLRLPDWILQRALKSETENYRAAKYVVTRSSWIIPTLVDFYGVDRSKIRHILPGANLQLPDGWIPPELAPRPGIDRDLVLGFVGKDWKRKGLPYLMDVRDELARRGYKAIVKVVGKAPPELQARSGMSFTGFIDKRDRMQDFVQVISRCDVGCLFSESEALGISVLEFLRVGVPVAGFYHQGLVDTLPEGASLRFQLGAKVSQAADAFEEYILEERVRLALRAKALEMSNNVTWATTVEKFGRLLNTSYPAAASEITEMSCFA